MIIRGDFKNINGNTRWFEIGNSGATLNAVDPTEEYWNNGSQIVLLPNSCVTISCDATTPEENHVICKTATIKLLVNFDISSYVVASNYTDLPVKIGYTDGYGNSVTLFEGFVEPLQYDIDFSEPWNEISLECYDIMSTLEYVKVPQLPGFDPSQPIQVGALINKIFQNASISYDVDYSNHSLVTTDDDKNNVLLKYVNPQLFLGDSEDDWMDCKEVLEMIGQMFSMWFVTGNVKNSFKCIVQDYPCFSTIINSTSDIDTLNQYVRGSQSYSLSETYQKVQLTCDIQENEDTVVDPFDSGQLSSSFSHMQKYMTELISAGEGNRAFNGIIDLVKTESSKYDGAEKKEHFFWVKYNDFWDFGEHSYITDGNGKGTANQWKTLEYLKQNPGKAAFISYGHTANLNNTGDNSPINSISLIDYLQISIQGHDDHSDNGHILQMEQQIQNNIPLMKYTSATAVNILPNDDNTVNYLIISGKILLNPLSPKSGRVMGNKYVNANHTYQEAVNDLTVYSDPRELWWHHTVPITDNGDGGYYVQKYWYNGNVSSNNYSVYNGNLVHGNLENDKSQQLKYEYSSSNNSNDTISKLPILECQLKIGDKYCVERLDRGEAGVGVFEWLYPQDCPLDEDGQPITTFTIGIDPKINDMIIGKPYDIQNNINYTMGIDGKGTAIPIHLSDQLSGAIEFQILGPVNQTWDQITKSKHGSLFWKHAHWNSKTYFILEMLDSILVSNFKIDFKSNNANIKNNSGDNDLVYVSDTDARYTDILELDTKLCSALTSEESANLGVKFMTGPSTLLDIDKTPLHTMRCQTGIHSYSKMHPEEGVVNFIYNWYNTPCKILKSQTMVSNVLYVSNNIVPIVVPSSAVSSVEDIYALEYSFDLQQNVLEYSIRL